MINTPEKPKLPLSDDAAGVENTEGFAQEDLPSSLEDESAQPESQDDDPYQESDEALPDDEEEKAIDKHLDGEAGRFGD